MNNEITLELFPEGTIEAHTEITEHKPYYSSVIFLGEQINTLEKAKELYVEEEV